jgi:hypothetical protein
MNIILLFFILILSSKSELSASQIREYTRYDFTLQSPFYDNEQPIRDTSVSPYTVLSGITHTPIDNPLQDAIINDERYTPLFPSSPLLFPIPEPDTMLLLSLGLFIVSRLLRSGSTQNSRKKTFLR